MQIVKLIDTTLHSSTITDGVYLGSAISAWAVGTTFAQDQYVYDSRSTPYKVYKSVSAGNVGNDPTTSDQWTWWGYTDRWAMFDEFINTQSQDTTSFTVEIDSSYCDYLGMFNLQAETIELTHIDNTELATDGDMSSDAFTAGDGWSYDSGGEYDCDGSQSAVSVLDQAMSVQSGKRYEVTLTVANYSAGNLAGTVGGTIGNYDIASNGSHKVILTAGSTLRAGVVADADFSGSVQLISVRKVPKEETLSLGTLETVSFYSYFTGRKVYRNNIKWAFPYYPDSRIRAEITWKTGSLAKCGSMDVGAATYIGGTLYEPTIDLISYSEKSTDDVTGNTTLIRGEYADEIDAKIWFPINQISAIRKKFKEIDGVKAIFDFNNDGIDEEILVIPGFFLKTSSTILGPTECRETIKVRGLI